MAKQFPSIGEAHREFVARQHVFFVASAAADSRVNVSPRSTDCLRVLGPSAVAYLDRTGSGNETAAHILAGGRVTIMFCAVAGAPSILRLYGRGTIHGRRDTSFRAIVDRHFSGLAPLGTRQIVELAVELVQTSCGFGVPLLDYAGERDAMDRWAEHRGKDGIEAYWRTNNVASIDGLPTGLQIKGTS